MITLKDFMTAIDYRITEGSEFGWTCFGPNAYCLTSNAGYDEPSTEIIFDTRDQTVFEVTVCSYNPDKAYRIINSTYLDAVKEESERRGVPFAQAWDDVEYIDLEVDEDMLEKIKAIMNKQPYDERVMISLTFSDAELLTYMKVAHEMDLTFNKFVEKALTEQIDRLKLEE